MSKKIMIFGFGYTAAFLAKKLVKRGFQVVGTTRKYAELNHYKTPYILIPFDPCAIEKHLESVTHILVSIPPTDLAGDPVLFAYSELLKKQAATLHWLGYLSSTGVYGNHQGRWVDENSPSIAPGKQGRLRLDAESAWTLFSHTHHVPLHIFRLAGIYGPQRNALARIRNGKTATVYKEDQFFSRIHVEDIAEMVATSMQHPHCSSIYNVCDDEPAPTHTIEEYAAALLHVPSLLRVPFADATLSPMSQEFYAQNKRVDNSRIKKELSLALHYPTYREGLTEIYRSGAY